MEYLVDGTKFSLRYSELREDYERYRRMRDEEFLDRDNLVNLIHFCCTVSYLKELNYEITLSDKGIIHELIHLFLGRNTRSLRDIREQFNNVMRLA